MQPGIAGNGASAHDTWERPHGLYSGRDTKGNSCAQDGLEAHQPGARQASGGLGSSARQPEIHDAVDPATTATAGGQSDPDPDTSGVLAGQRFDTANWILTVLLAAVFGAWLVSAYLTATGNPKPEQAVTSLEPGVTVPKAQTPNRDAKGAFVEKR